MEKKKTIKVALTPFGLARVPGLEHQFQRGFLIDLESLIRSLTGIGAAPVSMLFGKLKSDGTRGEDLPNVVLSEEAPESLREMIFKELAPDALVAGVIFENENGLNLKTSLYKNAREKISEKEFSFQRDNFPQVRYALLNFLRETFKPAVNEAGWKSRESFNADKFEAYRLYCLALVADKQEKRIEALRRAVELSPRFFDAVLMLGESLSQGEDRKSFEEYLQNLSRDFSGHAGALAFAAFAKMQLGDAAAALKSIEEAVAAAPDDSNMRAFKGYLLLSMRKYPEAETALKSAISGPFCDPTWYHFLGLSLAGQNKFREGIVAWEECLRRNPYYSAALLDMATAHEQLGEFERAEADYQKLLRQAPEEYMGRYRFGAMLTHLGRFAPAREQLEKCVELNPQFNWGHYDLGNALNGLGETEQARKSFQRAAELGGEAGRRAVDALKGVRIPDDPEITASLQKAAAAFSADEYNVAVDILEDVTRRAPKHWKAWYLLGMIYYKMNKIEAVAPAMRQAIAINPELFDAYVILVNSYLQMRQMEDARRALAPAKERFPEEPEILCASALIKAHSKEFDEARLLLNRALQKAPDKATVKECVQYIADLEVDKKWWQFWK